MANRSYSDAQRGEAIALAKLVGAREAGRQPSVDWRAIRGWAMDAGVDLSAKVGPSS